MISLRLPVSLLVCLSLVSTTAAPAFADPSRASQLFAPIPATGFVAMPFRSASPARPAARPAPNAAPAQSAARKKAAAQHAANCRAATAKARAFGKQCAGVVTRSTTALIQKLKFAASMTLLADTAVKALLAWGEAPEILSLGAGTPEVETLRLIDGALSVVSVALQATIGSLQNNQTQTAGQLAASFAELAIEQMFQEADGAVRSVITIAELLEGALVGEKVDVQIGRAIQNELKLATARIQALQQRLKVRTTAKRSL